MSLRAFIALSRLKFLAGGIAAGALGTAIAVYADGRFNGGAYLVAQGTITSFHLMTHYANDYFDRHSDVTATRTPYSGGSGILVAGTIVPAVALAAAQACAALGIVGSLALAAMRLPAAAITAIAVFAGAWAYSAPPFRLAARGLGEADTAIVVAVLVPLCAFLAQGAALDIRFFASVLPAAAAMFAMMLAVEFPDAACDAAGGKRNLVVRVGSRRARRLGIACVAATLGAFALALSLRAPGLYAAAAALAVPAGIALARAFQDWRENDRCGSVRLAGRGVVFFFSVTVCSFAAYAGSAATASGATFGTVPTVAGP